MFRKLLSSTSQKKLTLIESLLTDEKKYLNDLSKELSLSISTLRKYILEITTEIPYFEITIDNYTEVQLVFDSYSSLIDVYSFFLSRSSAFKLLEILFASSFTSYDMLAFELNLSKSSIIRLIKKVNSIISPYDFYISKKPIQISGDEKTIRQFYLIFFLEKYQHKFMDASKNQEQEFLKIAKTMAEATPVALYFSDIRKIAFVIYIHMKRDKIYTLEHQVDNIEYFVDKINLTDFTGHNEAYIQKMVQYVTNHLDLSFTDTDLLKQEFYALTCQIFARYGYHEEDFADKLDAVVYAYLPSISLKVPYYILDNRLDRYVKSCDPVEQTINSGIAEILKASNLPIIRENTIRYLIYTFHNFFPCFARKVINNCTKFHLALFYDTTSQHVDFIKEKIQAYVPYSIEISVINPLDSFSLSLIDVSFDLIMGNIVPLFQKTPFKHTDIFIKDSDIRSITHAIQQKGIHCLLTKEKLLPIS